MDNQTTLKGQIERITYISEENGFTVARVKAPGHRDLVTVVGSFAAVSPGEVLEMRGEWAIHEKFGHQFKVREYTTEVPATLDGIKKYLGSGLIRGVGPVMAGRITEKFGKNTLRIMETDIDQLRRVEGIGKKKLATIKTSWAEQQEIRGLMLFLQTHGVSSAYAVRIYKAYGDNAIEAVRSDPYRLATDIDGIGFVKADSIAEKLGFAKDDARRIDAGVLYALNQRAEDGHVYYPYGPFVGKCRQLLDVEAVLVTEAISRVAKNKDIAIEPFDKGRDEAGGSKGVFLAGLYLCETEIASRLKALVKGKKHVREVKDIDKALAWVQEKLVMTLADRQVEAVTTAVSHKMMVITGGPGTGKTTIVKAVLNIFQALGAKVLLAAPTGRAAKRMKEATGHEASTIHRMLEFTPGKGGFQRDNDRPLDGDLLIIDEASMIDTVLMYHLLKAVPPWSTFILVGDVNQLPSVGAGNVLNDIIASKVAPVVELNEIFRQARKSRIVVNAHQINSGEIPVVDNDAPDNDFFFIEQPEPEAVVDTIVELVCERIPRKFGVDPFNDIQVLTPMHKGEAGAANLNRRLQQALNPSGDGLPRGDYTLGVSDKVMQIRNNYDKEVFNGDIGRIARIDHNSRDVMIDIDGRLVAYDFSELDEVVPAYAISVHKSQGSEYPVVVMPLLTQHYILLQRNLLYTAVTRGRQLVVLVGTKKAMSISVNNNRVAERYTRLKWRLL